MYHLTNIMQYQDWVPVTDESRFFVESQQSIGMMRTTISKNEEGKYVEFARYTPIAYRFAKREDIQKKGGIRKLIHNYLCLMDLGDIAEALFVGDLKEKRK